MRAGEPSRNPEGRNGHYWMNMFKLFAEEATTAFAAEDMTTSKDAKIERARNVFQSLYKNAMLGRQDAIDKFMALLGIDAPSRVEMTGKDGQPLNGQAPVLFVMGDAGTLEDADPPRASPPPAADADPTEAAQPPAPPADDSTGDPE